MSYILTCYHTPYAGGPFSVTSDKLKLRSLGFGFRLAGIGHNSGGNCLDGIGMDEGEKGAIRKWNHIHK